MPFDGVGPRFERAPVAQDQLSHTRQEMAGAQRREADALEALKQAEDSRDAFFASAIGGARLNEDQKILLQQLKGDFSLARLQEVVHTDQETGASYTFADYFSHDVNGNDASDVLVAAKNAIRTWEDAQSTRMMSASIVGEKIKTAQNGEMPVNIQETARFTMPSLEGVKQGADGRLQEDGSRERALDQAFQNEWNAYNEKFMAHMQGIEAMMQQPKELVLPQRPRAEEPVPTPVAPAMEVAPDPFAFASHDAVTVMMPIAEVQKPTLAQSIATKTKAFFSKLFG